MDSTPNHRVICANAPRSLADEIDRAADAVGLSRAGWLLKAARAEIQRQARQVPRHRDEARVA